MPLFGRSDSGDSAQRAEESLAALEAGGLPLSAQERLAARSPRFFTSDLTVNEFLAIREAGFRPLVQVLGTCFYHVGYQWSPTWQAGGSTFAQVGGVFPTSSWSAGETVELETASEAWNDARSLALGRLSEEAAAVGADAVVGVRLQRGAYDWAAGIIEFIVTGTAVASDRFELPREDDRPLLSNLSGQDFAKLFRSGWIPVGLVAGSTVCYVMTGWQQQSRLGSGFMSSWQNQELTDFSRGMHETRGQAMLRVTRSAHELGAHGVVGVDLQHDEEEREADRGGMSYRDFVITMHVLGTAIVQVGREDDEVIYTALRLDEERK
jgi:uncharacterized protein YbjQ (UPF0145 family)